VHLDHGNEPATCMTAIQAGFTSVMMDGSLKADGKSPADWSYNVGVTKAVTDMAHLGGISVEGELGVLGSLETGMGDKEDGHGAEGKLSHDQLLTNPDEAVKFVQETKVDALAIAMGTSHGAYKFTRKPDGNILAMNRHQEWRAQDQYRHRQPHGDDRPDPESPDGKSGRVRSAQIPEAGDGSDDQAVQAAAAGIQYRGSGEQDQEGFDHGRDGEALRQGRARSENSVSSRGGFHPRPFSGRSPKLQSRRNESGLKFLM
jgi:hypothetical protein